MYIYTGWKLEDCDNYSKLMSVKDTVLQLEAGGTTLGHHVTYQFGRGCEVPPAATIKTRAIVHAPGRLTVAVVAVDGNITRPDGGIYHATLWVADGVKPVESNTVLKEYGTEQFEFSCTELELTLDVTPYGHPLN